MAQTNRNAASVAVVTINWNGADHTLRCLAALRQSRGADWHLYVVDNASTDTSLDQLRDLGRDVSVIASPVNGGWTGGNNLGIRAALDAGHDLILILNNDAFVLADTIATLVAAFDSAAAPKPVLGPVHRGAVSTKYDFVVAHRDPKTMIPIWTPREQQGGEVRNPLFATAYISGAGMLAHREHFQRVGLLDDRFYLNFDDTDWCARAQSAGFALMMVRDAVIDHVGSASIGGRASPLQTYFLARNRLLYARKHVPLKAQLRLARRYLWQARDLTGGRPFSLLRRQTDLVAAAFRRGVLDFLRGRFGDCPPEVRAWQAAFSREGAERAEA